MPPDGGARLPASCVSRPPGRRLRIRNSAGPAVLVSKGRSYPEPVPLASGLWEDSRTFFGWPQIECGNLVAVKGDYNFNDKQPLPDGQSEEEETVFEQVEHQSTPAEQKMLALEVVGAVTACAVIGGALIWFFGYYGT